MEGFNVHTQVLQQILVQQLDLDSTGKTKSSSPVSLQQHLVVAEEHPQVDLAKDALVLE